MCQPVSACVSCVFLDLNWFQIEVLEEAREAALAFEYSIDMLFAAQHPDLDQRNSSGPVVVKWLAANTWRNLAKSGEMDQVDTILCFRTGFLHGGQTV